MPALKNILIFVAIAAVFVLIYIYFIRPSPDDTPALVSSGGNTLVSNEATNQVAGSANSAVTQDFLNLLLSVKNIKLNDAIFSDPAFISLRDSSIILTQDGNEGRPNPFAPLGADVALALPLTCELPKILNTLTNTCVNPPSN